MDILRKAGRAIRDFDDAYSAKIGDMYAYLDKQGAPDWVTGAGVYLGGTVPSTRVLPEMELSDGPYANDIHKNIDHALSNASRYVLPAISTVPKYILPATGVTLAGKALYDLTGQFGMQTEGTLEP